MPETTNGGRPKVGRGILIRIPEEHIDYLDRHAAMAGQTRAEYVRRLIARDVGRRRTTDQAAQR